MLYIKHSKITEVSTLRFTCLFNIPCRTEKNVVHYQVVVIEVDRMKLWTDFEDNTVIPDTDH